MCEHCGCRQVEPIAELMDEHLELLEIAGDLRRAVLAGERVKVNRLRDALVGLLSRHTGREEAGVFAALRAEGEYVEEVDSLEGEHDDLDVAVARLDLDGPQGLEQLDRFVADLTTHIDRENLGIFPVAVVTLGATGWSVVERAHERSSAPTRDLDAAATG